MCLWPPDTHVQGTSKNVLLGHAMACTCLSTPVTNSNCPSREDEDDGKAETQGKGQPL